jgi:hypothetical protein
VLLVLGVTGPDPALCMCCDVFIMLTLQSIDHVTSQHSKLSGRNNIGKFLLHAQEGVRGSSGITPLILDLGVSCR